MVTPVEKRSSNKFCDFQNDKGHITNECMQLKKQIEELVRAGKLSHLIKEIKHGRDQSKARKKETPAKDKPTAPGNHRRRQSFHKSMDEFHDSHEMLKFPVERGIVTIRSTILIPNKCTSVITSSAVSKKERTLAEHRLNIREGYSHVRQKKKGQAPERAKAIQAEVQKLVEAGIMGEVYYHDWLSNPIMVKKHDGSWQMCVDFTDLNKACPQDCYPISEIDWKVKSLCGYPFKCFLDAYKCYHQIQLAELDEKKTTFHTGQGVYYYIKMPFGLKNVGATYQRLMDKAFDSQIGRNIEVYVDDLVVKSYTEAEMLRDIDETFRTQETSTVFPSASYHGHYRSTHQANNVSSRRGRTAAKMKYHARRTQYYVQAKNVGQRTDLSGFSYRNSGRKPTSRASGRNSTRAWTLFTDDSSSSNNEAKYEALIASLRIAAQMGVQNVHVSVDSKLVANHVLGTYVAKEENMVNDRKEARKLRIKARQYELIEENLYRRSFLTPWLRCVGPLQAEYVIREIHEGWCSMHAGPRYLETGLGKRESDQDAATLKHSFSLYSDTYGYNGLLYEEGRYKQPLTPITAPWPFYKRGIDTADPFLEGPGKVKFLIVAMDYFTKWIKAKAVATITSGQIGIPTYRTTAVDVVSNDEELRLNLDLLEERREGAVICEAKAKLKMMKYYNARVRGVTFRPVILSTALMTPVIW
nr:reverse transcriptase domain-containing protein [Tanacetum cinerariifolium]